MRERMNMKKEYVAPVIVGEEFSANEYVAACWTVACKVGNGNYGGYGEEQNWQHWDEVAPYGTRGDMHNHTGSCSIAVNNQFKVEGNNVSFYAENNDQQGSLNGGYTDYIDENKDGIINDGDIIFWYTLGSNPDRRWNHYGVVTVANKSHPNRS